jgi:hypothetical protein
VTCAEHMRACLLLISLTDAKGGRRDQEIPEKQ